MFPFRFHFHSSHPVLRSVLPLLTLLIATGACAQSGYQPLDQESYHWMDRFEIKSGRFFRNIHTSTKPYLRQDIVNALKDLDTMKTQPKWSTVDRQDMQWLRIDNNEWSKDTAAKSKHPILRYFYKDKANFYTYNDVDFMVKVDPVVEFGLGYQKNSLSGRQFVNTRGVELRGWISRKVGFYFFATENQMRPPDYVRQYITAHSEVPYAGYYKDFKITGYDFFNARGYINFKPVRPITVTFGADRNVIGNGERSLFMSDFSNEYLFLKLETKVWKLNYTNIFMEGIENYNHYGGDRLSPKRYAAFHHLSLNATRWMNIGLFEGVVFTRGNGFELHYLNPIIFYRSTEQYLGSPDNAVMGLDGKINCLRHLSLYGQFLLDDININELRHSTGYWGNKFGMQGGVKYVDAFTVPNLDLQGEINLVKPYTYTHSDSTSSYTNYNLPIAHPLGANFFETVGVIRYQPIQSLTVTLKSFLDVYGVDTLGSNWGSDITIPTGPQNVETVYGNKIGQGVRVKQAMATANVVYEIRHNLFIDLYAAVRVAKYATETLRRNTQYGQLTVRWNIPPRHYEF